MSGTMGHVVSNDPTHTCDGCDSTYTGTWSEVQKYGWKRHTQTVFNKPKFEFVLCGDCEAEFEARRAAKQAEAA